MTGADPLATDRAKLADFLHHPAEDCDAAARRLSRSVVPHDRAVAAEWIALRSTRCVRLKEPAESSPAG